MAEAQKHYSISRGKKTVIYELCPAHTLMNKMDYLNRLIGLCPVSLDMQMASVKGGGGVGPRPSCFRV